MLKTYNLSPRTKQYILLSFPTILYAGNKRKEFPYLSFGFNIFLVINGVLTTTSTTDDILVGVTRNTVIELARELGIPVKERAIDRTELYLADEVFCCGTGAQIVPVESIDHRPVGDGKIGQITKQIQTLYYDVVKGKVEKFKEWCTPVYD